MGGERWQATTEAGKQRAQGGATANGESGEVADGGGTGRRTAAGAEWWKAPDGERWQATTKAGKQRAQGGATANGGCGEVAGGGRALFKKARPHGKSHEVFF